MRWPRLSPRSVTAPNEPTNPRTLNSAWGPGSATARVKPPLSPIRLPILSQVRPYSESPDPSCSISHRRRSFRLRSTAV
jgi:hypothetical protein